MTTFAHASSKLGKVKPETRSKAEEIFNAAKAAGHDIWFMWGMGSSAEHSTGRALDLMVKTHAAGQWVRDYIWKNRARLRLQHVIWEQKITSTVTRPGVVRKMEDRGNSTENHMDHNHVLFLVGAYVAPDKVPAKPPVVTPKPPVKPPAKPPVPGAATAKVVAEVIAGKWGNGPARKDKLRKAGWNPSVIQALVNQAVKRGPRKGMNHIVAEVIAGEWGNGDERKRRLTDAGYNYADVQTAVNKRF